MVVVKLWKVRVRVRSYLAKLFLLLFRTASLSLIMQYLIFVYARLTIDLRKVLVLPSSLDTLCIHIHMYIRTANLTRMFEY